MYFTGSPTALSMSCAVISDVRSKRLTTTDTRDEPCRDRSVAAIWLALRSAASSWFDTTTIESALSSGSTTARPPRGTSSTTYR